MARMPDAGLRKRSVPLFRYHRHIVDQPPFAQAGGIAVETELEGDPLAACRSESIGCERQADHSWILPTGVSARPGAWP